MLFGRKKPGFVVEEPAEQAESVERQDLLEYLISLPEAEDQEFGDIVSEKTAPSKEELTEAQHLAEYIRLRTQGILLTSHSSLIAEVEGAEVLVSEWETDQSCQDIVVRVGNKDKYYYSNRFMSDNYAMIAALVEEQDMVLTIAEMVRFNCKTYPAPTPFSYFEQSPYQMTRPQLDRAVEMIKSHEQCQDIQMITNNAGVDFFFSIDHMSKKYAKALADVDEYTD